MKVFIYRKEKPYARICVLTGVVNVEYKPEENRIVIHSSTMGAMEFDTRFVKTSIFKN